MVGGFFLGAGPAVDSCAAQSVGGLRAEQEMVDAEYGMRARLRLIVPKSVEARIGRWTRGRASVRPVDRVRKLRPAAESGVARHRADREVSALTENYSRGEDDGAFEREHVPARLQPLISAFVGEFVGPLGLRWQ